MALGLIFSMFFVGPAILFNIYIMSWLNYFHDDGKGPIKDPDQVLLIFQLQGVIGCIISFSLLGGVGYLSDRISPKVMLPAMLLLHAVNMYFIFTIENPMENYYLTVFFISLTHFTWRGGTVVMNSFLAKLYPKEIRGMCLSVQSIFFLLGTLLFTQYCEILYEQYDAKNPFLGCAITDVALAVIIGLLGICGKFGNID